MVKRGPSSHGADLITDFETVNTDGVDLRVVGAAVYSEHPATQILVVTFLADNGLSWVWHPGDPTDEIDELVANPEITFVSHGDFERYIWQNQMERKHGFMPLPIERWADTMAVALYKGLPGKLEKVAAVLGLREKDAEGSKLTVSLSKKPELIAASRERVDKYNMSDCITELELHQRVGKLSAYERPIWELDQRINQRGVKLDLPYIDACQRVIDRAAGPMLDEFAKITGGLKPTQRDKVMVWLEGEGVFLGDLRKERIAALLGDDDEVDNADFYDRGSVGVSLQLPPHVRRALTIRQLLGSAAVKKLKRLKQCVCDDGRTRGMLQYCGAHNQRWAGRLWQPHNFPLRQVPFDYGPDELVAAIHRGDLDELYAVYGDPYSAVITGLKQAVVAEDGKELAAGDYSGIEMRIVLALAGQYDKVELVASGADVYLDMACDIYSVPKGSLDKHNDEDKRQIGKKTVLGSGYRLGGDAFCRRYVPGCQCVGTVGPCRFDADPPECCQFARRTIRAYRKVWAPKVEKMWFAFEDASLEALKSGEPYTTHGCTFVVDQNWLTIYLPSGSRLWYYNPQIVKRRMPWNPDDIRETWTFQVWKNGRFQTETAHGGMLTGNIVPNLARCLLVEAMFRMERERFPVVMTIHDEIVSETDRLDFKAFRQLMEIRPAWAEQIGIPVKVEGGMDRRWRKW